MHTGSYKSMKKETIKTIVVISAIIFIVNGIFVIYYTKFSLFGQIVAVFNIVGWSFVLGYLYKKNE